MLEWLQKAVEQEASDIFIGAGRCISFKIRGKIEKKTDEVIKPAEAEALIRELYELAKRSTEHMGAGDDDFPVTIPGLARFRVNVYRQRSTMAAIVRVVLFNIPNYVDLRIPEKVMSAANEKDGLVVVTGPAGGGKSTTLACIIDAINKTRNCHIITVEDPIEYLHRDDKSIISQREIYTDTESYSVALRASLRQVPDIILLGEMRDFETIRTAVTAGETGHLVISTLHTVGAANTIDRIIDTFPPNQQHQIRVQLSMVLRMVISQKLIQNVNGETVPVFEVMRVNNAISNLIREAKTHQIDNFIKTSSGEGMIGMDTYIYKLFTEGIITRETALASAMNIEQMQRKV
jgi:twitching motility protein PilT